MDNVINFDNMQAVILNPKLLEQIRLEEATNKEFEDRMDKEIQNARIHERRTASGEEVKKSRPNQKGF